MRDSRQRTRFGVVFWLLLFVSSLPWIALVLDWEKWQMLEPGTRGAAYLLSIILVNAALTSWLSPLDESPGEIVRDDPSGGRGSHAEGSGTIYLPTLAQRGRIL